MGKLNARTISWGNSKMKCWFFLILFAGLAAFLFAAEPELSGVFDSTVNYTAGDRDASDHSWGIEEYANLRLRVRAGEKATFFAAFNLIAMAGNYLETAEYLGILTAHPPFTSTPLIHGPNYAAALELERLYFRINGDYIDAEAGLLRMNFGYGQVWGSSDFLNPRNPLIVNARPRGLLGMNLSFYPTDSLKLMGFVAGPAEPLKTRGGGIIPGLSLDQHWNRLSLQALYAYETPLTASPNGIHRFGLSLKADMELGLVADALYSLNPDKLDGIDGLSAGIGFDYSFFDGNLYILFEYLFNGLSSATAFGHGGNWSNRHYLYGTALYRFNDYFNLSLSTIFCFDDVSFSPFVTLNYEFFQGFSLNCSARVCFDKKDFGGSTAGELGPASPGARLMVNAGVRLRF